MKQSRLPVWSRLICGGVVVFLAAWTVLCAFGPGQPAGAISLIPDQMWPPFGDLNVILQGCDIARQGGDALASDSHPYNYPSLWTQLHHLGLSVVHTPIAGLVVCFSFLSCIVLLVRRSPPVVMLMVAGCLLSPPVLTALNRANSDLIIFSLLTLSGQLAATTWPSVIAATLTAFTAMLKLYPLFAVGSLATPRTRPWLAVFFACCAASLLLAWEWQDIIRALGKTPKSDLYSYGAIVPGLRLQARGFITSSQRVWVDALSIGVTVLTGLAGYCLGRRAGASELRNTQGDRALHLPTAGVLIFAATFIFSSNWLYRLIFLLWCIPGLPWSDKAPHLRHMARLSGTLCLALLWSYAWPANIGTLLSQFFAVLLVGCFGFWLGALPPPLLRWLTSRRITRVSGTASP